MTNQPKKNKETSMPTQRQAFQAGQAFAKGNGDLVRWLMAVLVRLLVHRSCGANASRTRLVFVLLSPCGGRWDMPSLGWEAVVIGRKKRPLTIKVWPVVPVVVRPPLSLVL